MKKTQLGACDKFSFLQISATHCPNIERVAIQALIGTFLLFTEEDREQKSRKLQCMIEIGKTQALENKIGILHIEASDFLFQ